MREFTCEHGNKYAEYTCTECGGEFITDQSYADALMEYQQEFSEQERVTAPPAFVCEDCYNKAMEELNVNCHCGRPLHYQNKAIEMMVKAMVRRQGEYVRVTLEGRTWLVQRHYIALHGIRSRDLPFLGFQEVTGDAAESPGKSQLKSS